VIKALKHGVGRDRRAVHQRGNIAEAEVEPLTREPQSGNQSLRGIVRRGRRLCGEGLACRLVEDFQIGESATYIDGDADAVERFSGLHSAIKTPLKASRRR
jgi:hypothetical protein